MDLAVKWSKGCCLASKQPSWGGDDDSIVVRADSSAGASGTVVRIESDSGAIIEDTGSWQYRSEVRKTDGVLLPLAVNHTRPGRTSPELD